MITPLFLLTVVPLFLGAGIELSLFTDDKMKIAATLWLPDGTDHRPAVVLIHQGGSSREEWGAMPAELVKQGYVVLAYDVRGHGGSTKVENIYPLFNDPNLAPKDLWTVLDYLRAHERVDSKRLAVVGSSIGGNLACVASGIGEVKTAVHMSGKTSAVYNLAGTPELAMRSVFHISSKGDQGGKREQWARELYQKTSKPRKLMIVEGKGHGVSMFTDDPTLTQQIYAWLKETL